MMLAHQNSGGEEVREPEMFTISSFAGKEWFPRLYFTPSTLIVQNTSALDPGQPGSDPASATF